MGHITTILVSRFDDGERRTGRYAELTSSLFNARAIIVHPDKKIRYYAIHERANISTRTRVPGLYNHPVFLCISRRAVIILRPRLVVQPRVLYLTTLEYALQRPAPRLCPKC